MPVSNRTLAALVSASSLLLVGCGGEGSARTPLPAPPPVQLSLTGFWSGVLTSTNPAESGTAFAIISPASDVRIISGAGFQYVSGSGAPGLGKAYAPAGKAFSNGASVASMTSKDTDLEASSQSGATFMYSCQVGGDAVRFVSSAPSAAYATPLNLADLSGNYTSLATDNSLGQVLTLAIANGAGSIAVPGGGTFAVGFTIPNPARTAVDLTLTPTPAGGAPETAFPGTGSCVPGTGGAGRVLTFGAAGGNRSFCGKFTRN